jgi:hypothetical protein
VLVAVILLLSMVADKDPFRHAWNKQLNFMRPNAFQSFPWRRAAGAVLLVAGAVPLFCQVPFHYREGWIDAELILDGGLPPAAPTPSQAAFASFFSNPIEGILQYGRGQLVDGSWNISGRSPMPGDTYPPGPCGSILPAIPYPFATLFTAEEVLQPNPVFSTAAALPGHLPQGDYGGTFLLKAGTDQHTDVNDNPQTPGLIDGLSIPYWTNLRCDLTPTGRKTFYAQSFRSSPLLPHDLANGLAVDTYTRANLPIPNPIVEPVGAINVQVCCPIGGVSSLLRVESAFITATIDTATTSPSCDPPYPDWRGAKGTVQASVDLPGGGLLDETFLVRANLSYVVKVEFVVYDLLGNVDASYSAPATVAIPQGDVVYVKINVDPLFCDSGAGCNSDLGTLQMNHADVFLDMVHIPPDVSIRKGPFGTSKMALVESPLSAPTADPNGVTYAPAPNYKLGNVLPSRAVWPQVWPDTPYTPRAQFYFKTTGGLFQHMMMFSEPKMYNCIGFPLQGEQEVFFVMEPGYLRGDIVLCGPVPAGTARTCIELITAEDLTQTSRANNFFNLPYYSIVTANLPYNASYTEGAIRETPGRTPTLFLGQYELFLAGTNGVPFSSWKADGLILRMDQTFGPSYLAIYDRLASGTLNRPLDVYPAMSYRNDHNYCVSEIMVKILNAGAQPVAAPQILCQGSYSGPDPLYPTQSMSPDADYTVTASYWGTPTSLTTGPLNVLLGLPKGSYSLTPSVEKQGGGRASFPGLSLPDVGCKERITMDLVINGEAPMVYVNSDCTSQPNYVLKGGVQAISGHTLTEVSYTLNGGGKNVVPTGPGASFDLANIGPIPLGQCQNTILIAATDDQALVTVAPVTITLDDTPPVLTGCVNLTVPAEAGQSGAAVNFNPTATDNCDESIQPACHPPSGSFFNTGCTEVTCAAVDTCGNGSTCKFNVCVVAGGHAEGCSLTQGFYGNPTGKFNVIPSLTLLNSLLTPPLVVGKFGVRSLSIPAGAAVLLQNSLPAGGQAISLPNNGDQNLPTATMLTSSKGNSVNSKFANILLGQTITLALNVRLDANLLSFPLPATFCTQGTLPGPDARRGTSDDILVAGDFLSFSIPASVLAALSDAGIGILNGNVQGLLELANRGLAGLSTGAATLADINAGVDAINRGFDNCRVLVDCATHAPVPPSGNDLFGAPILLGGGGAGFQAGFRPAADSTLQVIQTTAFNCEAGKESGEPDLAGNAGGKSLWWQWQATRSGWVTIQTAGSSFDTLLGVFVGPSLSNLTLIASQDDVPPLVTASVGFEALAGAHYLIAVDGYDSACGSIVLTLVTGAPGVGPLELLSNDEVRIGIDGEPGQSYSVEASTDLVTWTEVATVEEINGTLRFPDPQRTEWRQRFYRVRIDLE